MATFGGTKKHRVEDSKGNTLTKVDIEFYPTKADAEAGTNRIGKTRIDVEGDWTFDTSYGEVWCKVQDYGIWKETDLSSTFAQNVTLSHMVRKDEARKWKGGVVGLGGKAAVCFRIDHGLDYWLSAFWPEFKARNMPASVGIVTDIIGNPSYVYEGTTATWADILTEAKKGFEVWSHTATHRDPAITGNTIEYELVGSRDKIEANGLRCIGFQQAGITPRPAAYDTDVTNMADWGGTLYGQTLLANYGLIEVAGANGFAERNLPTFGDYDLGHKTLDQMTLQQAKDSVDNCIARGQGVQFMVHPKFVEVASVPWTLQNMKDLLDYVKTKRDAGLLEVLTASGMAFADPSTSWRANLLADSDFENMPLGEITSQTQTTAVPWCRGSTAGVRIMGDGGHSGSKYVRIDAVTGYPAARQGVGNIVDLRQKGQTLEVSGWMRAHTGDATAWITVRDPGSNARLETKASWPLTVAQGWVRFRMPFTIPMDPATTSITVELTKMTSAATGGIDYDEVRIRPV